MDDVRPLGSPAFANPPRTDLADVPRPRGVPRARPRLRDDDEDTDRGARDSNRDDDDESAPRDENAEDGEDGKAPAPVLEIDEE